MKNLNWNRVANLLRYDYKMEQRRVGTAILIILSIIAGLALLKVLGGAQPGEIGAQMNSQLSIGLFAMVFVLTKVVQTKFTDPRSSVAYSTLPGSPLEKYLVLLADYAIGFGTLAVLYVPVFYIVMLLGQLIGADANWMINIFQPQTFQEAFDQVYTSINIEGEELNSLGDLMGNLMDKQWFYTLCNWLIALQLFLVYVMLNVHFSGSTQLKSTGTIAIALLILSITACSALTATLVHLSGNEPELMTRAISTVETSVKALVIALPFIDAGLLYGLYRQLKAREAK